MNSHVATIAFSCFIFRLLRVRLSFEGVSYHRQFLKLYLITGLQSYCAGFDRYN